MQGTEMNELLRRTKFRIHAATESCAWMQVQREAERSEVRSHTLFLSELFVAAPHTRPSRESGELSPSRRQWRAQRARCSLHF